MQLSPVHNKALRRIPVVYLLFSVKTLVFLRLSKYFTEVKLNFLRLSFKTTLMH